jgi:hypothetical protein
MVTSDDLDSKADCKTEVINSFSPWLDSSDVWLDL